MLEHGLYVTSDTSSLVLLRLLAPRALVQPTRGTALSYPGNYRHRVMERFQMLGQGSTLLASACSPVIRGHWQGRKDAAPCPVRIWNLPPVPAAPASRAEMLRTRGVCGRAGQLFPYQDGMATQVLDNDAGSDCRSPARETTSLHLSCVRGTLIDTTTLFRRAGTSTEAGRAKPHWLTKARKLWASLTWHRERGDSAVRLWDLSMASPRWYAQSSAP